MNASSQNSRKHSEMSRSSGYRHYKEKSDYSQPSKKRSNCYLLLNKKYFGIIDKGLSSLASQLKKEIRDINDIQHDYNISGYSDYVFKLSAYKNHSKAIAIRMICDYLFRELEKTYTRMSFLKITLLVPDHVIGFIIGIEGKNINSIRDETKARIEVYPPKNSAKFREIEISGSPIDISRASERIFMIEEKYINFNRSAPSKEQKDSYRRSRSRSRSRSRKKYEYERRRRPNQSPSNKPSINISQMSNRSAPKVPSNENNKEEAITEEEKANKEKEGNKRSTIQLLFSKENLDAIKNKKELWKQICEKSELKVTDWDIEINKKPMRVLSIEGSATDTTSSIFQIQQIILGLAKEK